MNTEIIDAGRDISGGYKVDVSRGTNVDRVSSEWFSRPDDERYLSLDQLFASDKGRAERSRTRTVESAAIRVEAHRDNPEKLDLVLPGADEPIAPTHWSFGQLSSLVGAPAAYLRQLPAPLAGINLQYGLTNHRSEQIKTMEVADGRTELRAVTGPAARAGRPPCGSRNARSREMPARSSGSDGRPPWSTIQVSRTVAPRAPARTRTIRHCCGKSTIDAVFTSQ